MNEFQNGPGKRPRRHFSGQQKAAIVKQHLVDGVAISDLCESHFSQLHHCLKVGDNRKSD